MATRIIQHKPINQPIVNNVRTNIHISGPQLLHFLRYDLVGYLWLMLLVLGMTTLFLRHWHTTEENTIAISWFTWTGFIGEAGLGGLGGIIGMGFGFSPEQVEMVVNPLAIIVAIPTIFMLIRGLASYLYRPVQPVPQRI